MDTVQLATRVYEHLVDARRYSPEAAMLLVQEEWKEIDRYWNTLPERVANHIEQRAKGKA